MTEQRIASEQHPGAVLREMRTSRGMTLQDLSNASGVSISMISKVETGSGDPSLSTLRELASALKVPVAMFFRDDVPSDGSVVHVNHKQTYEFDGVQTTVVVPVKGSRTRLLQLRAEPGAYRASADFWATNSLEAASEFEYVLIISGRLELEVAGGTYLLEEGDSIAFPSWLPRAWRNAGTTTMHAVLCVSYSGTFDEPPGQRS